MTDNENPRLLSPLTLAYIGDAVFELFVRERVVGQGNAPVNKLHKKTVDHVSAKSQSKAVEKIIDSLSEQELAVYKRGRNAECNVPKSSTPAEYHRSTGLEALFGYLYLKRDYERLNELFFKLWE